MWLLLILGIGGHYFNPPIEFERKYQCVQAAEEVNRRLPGDEIIAICIKKDR